MNIQGIIERIEGLDKLYGEKFYVALDDVLDLVKQLDEPEKPIRLKDVIKRIQGFDDETKFKWTYDILQEFGSDFGSKIFHEAYQQGKVEGMVEREKVKVPQFVADWIEVAKSVYSLSGGMTYGGPGVNKWLESEDNQRTFALAWLDGYEVEKEKRYLVKVKGVCGNHETLNCEKHSNEWLFSSSEENRTYKTKFTRKELEGAGFGWVFDCPGIEIEEVK